MLAPSANRILVVVDPYPLSSCEVGPLSEYRVQLLVGSMVLRLD